MTNQTNTSGGANVDGNVNVKNGDAVLRDKNIYYITVVGNLLSWAQVEGLFPQIKGNDFTSVVDAVEGALNTRLKGDLVNATAFAGEILSDFVNESLIKYAGKPIPLSEFVTTLIDNIGYKLKANSYWEAYLEKTFFRKGTSELLKLDTLTMLYSKKIGGAAFRFGIIEFSISTTQPRFRLVRATFLPYSNKYTSYDICSPQEYKADVLRIFITGIVLDLIRIYSDNTISVQFLNELSNLFKAK